MAGKEVRFDVVAADKASRVVDDVADKAERLEKLDPTVDVAADTASAVGDVDAFARKLSGLTAADQVVLLALKAGAAQVELTDLATDIARLDASDPTVDVKLGQYAQTSAQLDDLETKIKAIADADPDAGAALEKARGRLKGIGEEADNAKGAVHSMAGNAIGDFAATATGVGPLGEALGQLSETALGAEGSISQIAAAGAGMAGLAAAMYVVNNAMKSIAASKAFHTDEVKSYTEAIRDGADAATALEERLIKAGRVMATPTGGNLSEWLGFSDSVVDLTEKVVKSGLTVTQYSQLVAGNTRDVGDWAKAQVDAGADAKLIADVMDQILQAHKDLREAQKNSATSATFFGDAQQRAAEATRRSAAEAKTSADALTQWADKTGKAVTGMQAFADAVHGQDWGRAGLDAAVTAMSDFTTQHNALIDINADSKEAVDAFTQSIHDNGASFNVATEKGRANQSALEDVARTIDTKLAAAYKDSGGDMDDFKRRSQAISDDAIQALMPALKGSGLSAQDLAVKLGLLPEDIETRYKLAGDEEAKSKIALLQSSIDNLPDDVQTKVTQQIIAGDYVGALATVNNYYAGHPATVQTTIEPPSQKDLNAMLGSLRTFFGNNPITVKTIGKTETTAATATATVPTMSSAAAPARWARINGRG